MGVDKKASEKDSRHDGADVVFPAPPRREEKVGEADAVYEPDETAAMLKCD